MTLFGVAPERCHNYRVEGLQTRRLRRYDYRCACRTHQLTSTQDNRKIRAGLSLQTVRPIPRTQKFGFGPLRGHVYV